MNWSTWMNLHKIDKESLLQRGRSQLPCIPIQRTVYRITLHTPKNGSVACWEPKPVTATDWAEFNFARGNPELVHPVSDHERQKWQSLNAARLLTLLIYKTVFLANNPPITLHKLPPWLVEARHPTWTGKPSNYDHQPQTAQPADGLQSLRGSHHLGGQILLPDLCPPWMVPHSLVCTASRGDHPGHMLLGLWRQQQKVLTLHIGTEGWDSRWVPLKRTLYPMNGRPQHGYLTAACWKPGWQSSILLWAHAVSLNEIRACWLTILKPQKETHGK